MSAPKRSLARPVAAVLLALAFVLAAQQASAPEPEPSAPPAPEPPPRHRTLERPDPAAVTATRQDLARTTSAAGPAAGAVRVRITTEAGEPDAAAWAEALDCPGLRPSSGAQEPHVLVYQAFAGRCALRAVRHDGLLRTEGAPVTVTVPDGGSVDVTLQIPSTRTGGVQMAFQPAPGGVRVLWVPPEVEGIARGDLIVAVDGERVADLDAYDVIALLTGPEGGTRAIELRRDDDTATPTMLLDLVLDPVEPP